MTPTVPALLLIPTLVLGCARDAPPSGVPEFEARSRAKREQERPTRLTREMLKSADHGAPEAERALRVVTDKRAQWMSDARTRCATELSASLCDKPPAGVSIGGPTQEDIEDCKKLCQPEIETSLDQFFATAKDECVDAFVQAHGQGRLACDKELPAMADVSSDDVVKRRAECGHECISEGKEKLNGATRPGQEK